jgi:sugar lactone lactonase YvrE
MLSTDGLSIDRRTGDIYIADFLGNALHKVDPKTGKVTTIARNGNTDGSGGALDRPSEPCVRGNKVYVANIDLPLAGNATDKPHTISVVTLHD